MSDNCIFCKIIKGDIPSSKVYEDDHILAFNDIHPAAPVHVLVVPKKHIENLDALNDENTDVLVPIHKGIQKVAELTGLKGKGYRVIINCGKEAGQTVFHLHYHVLGGRELGERIL